MEPTIAYQNETKEPVTYTIEYWALGKLNKLIERLNRRAVKLGAPPLKFNINIIEKTLNTYLDQLSNELQLCKPYTKKFLEVSFEGNPAKINDWEFLGTIQHAEPQNILRTVPGRPEIPETFRTVKPHCEHCAKYRSRKDSFVLAKRANDPVAEAAGLKSVTVYKQIGRNCLRDFLGHDPTMALQLMDTIKELQGEEDSRNFRKRMLPPFEVVEMAAAVALAVGFSKDSARWAWDYIFKSKELHEQIKKGRMPDIRPSNESRELAERTLGWLESAEVNGFISNIKAALNMKYTTQRESTLVAWAVGAYLKEMERDKLAQTKAQLRREQLLKERELFSASKHVGQISERMEINATLLQTRKVGISDEGTTLLLHKLITEEGNVITWFTQNDLRADLGQKMRVRFTVKEHRAYNGVLETAVNRLSIQNEIVPHTTEPKDAL